jgi:hypothetical protein
MEPALMLFSREGPFQNTGGHQAMTRQYVKPELVKRENLAKISAFVVPVSSV